MGKPMEDCLYQAVVSDDQEAVSQLLLQGADPNKTTWTGKTCLGETAKLGNISILKLLINASDTTNTSRTTHNNSTCSKRQVKYHKWKISHEEGQHDATVMKYKNLSDKKTFKENQVRCENVSPLETEQNQGYFVLIHSDESSSDEGRISNVQSPLSSPALTLSSPDDLEWDDDILNVAPTTSEDETWASMYTWYADILEHTGEAIASASFMTNGIDQQDAFTRTALYYAAEESQTEAAKLLIDAGCKVDIYASNGFTALHIAVAKECAEMVELLLLAGSRVNNKTHEKMTPLHIAALRGYLDLVKILHSHGAHLEAREEHERTPIYLAVWRGHIDIVQYLISAGASVNGEEIHGFTPLCEAVWLRRADLVEVLLNAGARIMPSHRLLHNAIIRKNEKIVQMLANIGVGINLHNDNGDTPLLMTARLSVPKIARMLLERGANVNACNSITGANALHIAVENIKRLKEFEELLLCLLEYKIDMNSLALTGDTALNRALLLNRDDYAVLLIRHGADADEPSDLHFCGLDNLSIASRRNSYYIARLLLKAGHNVPTRELDAPAPKRKGTAEHWLYYASRQPLSLSDLCRIRIRQLGRNKMLFQYIESLPLPRSIQRYLKLEDLTF